MKRTFALSLLAVLLGGIIAWFIWSQSPRVKANVDFLPPNATDVALELTGIPGNSTLFTVDGIPVSTQVYLYWMSNQADEFYNTMGYYNQNVALDTEMEDGVTWGDWLKDVARKNAALVALAPELGRHYGVALTQEELDELARTRQANVDALGGEEAYGQRMQAFGIDDEAFFRMQEGVILLNKIEEQQVAVSQDCTTQETRQYAEDNDLLLAKHILLLTMDLTTREPYDQATAAAQHDKAQDLLDQLRAQPDRFDELMAANSEDTGLAYYPNGYVFTAGEMVAEFEDATRALDWGEISDVVESTYGYHIILRLDPDNDLVREKIIEDRRSAAEDVFSQELEDRLAAADIKTVPAYDTISIQQYYADLLNYQEQVLGPVVDDQSGAELEPAG